MRRRKEGLTLGIVLPENLWPEVSSHHLSSVKDTRERTEEKREKTFVNIKDLTHFFFIID